MLKLPSSFPTPTPEKISIADKIALFEVGLQEGWSPAGLRNASGVDDRTLGLWREDVARARREGKTAGSHAAKPAADRPLPRIVSKPKPAEPARRKNGPSGLTEAEKRALLERQAAEGLSNAKLAEIAGVTADSISQWRKDMGFAGTQGRPSQHSEAKQKEAVAAVRNGMSVLAASKEFGVAWTTIDRWMEKDAMRKPEGDTAVKHTSKPAEVVPSNAMRPVSITRPDGTRIELSLTAEEIAALIGIS